jgi:hydrogenase nickel incorporation protein HypA/HybF
MQKSPRLSAIIDQLLQQPTRPVGVNIAVGELTHFAEDEICAQWNELVKNTFLAQSSLMIHMKPAEQQCMVCFQKYHPLNKETSCPNCGSVGAKIIAGEEFYLESVEAENE